VRFDLSHLNWLGSINSEVAVTAAWHTAPHKTTKDLFEQELIVGGTAGVDPETTPRPFNLLLGTKFKIINSIRAPPRSFWRWRGVSYKASAIGRGRA
jgi:hypothetical protein